MNRPARILHTAQIYYKYDIFLEKNILQ